MPVTITLTDDDVEQLANAASRLGSCRLFLQYLYQKVQSAGEIEDHGDPVPEPGENDGRAGHVEALSRQLLNKLMN